MTYVTQFAIEIAHMCRLNKINIQSSVLITPTLEITREQPHTHTKRWQIYKKKWGQNYIHIKNNGRQPQSQLRTTDQKPTYTSKLKHQLFTKQPQKDRYGNISSRQTNITVVLKCANLITSLKYNRKRVKRIILSG